MVGRYPWTAVRWDLTCLWWRSPSLEHQTQFLKEKLQDRPKLFKSELGRTLQLILFRRTRVLPPRMSPVVTNQGLEAVSSTQDLWDCHRIGLSIQYTPKKWQNTPFLLRSCPERMWIQPSQHSPPIHTDVKEFRKCLLSKMELWNGKYLWYS